MIQLKRADFYIYKTDSLLYHLKNHPNDAVRLHFDCCGGEHPMYLGFSRRSRHYASTKNVLYDSSKALSPKNDPQQLSNSIALDFANAVRKMDETFVSRAIYYNYFSDNSLCKAK